MARWLLCSFLAVLVILLFGGVIVLGAAHPTTATAIIGLIGFAVIILILSRLIHMMLFEE